MIVAGRFVWRRVDVPLPAQYHRHPWYRFSRLFLIVGVPGLIVLAIFHLQILLSLICWAGLKSAEPAVLAGGWVSLERSEAVESENRWRSRALDVAGDDL